MQYQNAETMTDMREEHKHAVKGIQKRYNEALVREKSQLEETRSKILFSKWSRGKTKRSSKSKN